MNRPIRSFRWPSAPAACLLLAVPWLAPSGALAQAPAGRSETASGAAVASCERAARQAVAGPPGQPVEVTFDAAPVVQPYLSGDEQIVLRGAGKGRSSAGGVRAFTYSCSVDPKTSESVGLVLRAVNPVAEAAPGPAPAEPNLSELSPAACESRAVAALKQRWPRVSQITFDRTTRSFRQTNAARGELHGSGLAKPTPTSPATVFTYDCEVDPRDGRVVRTGVS